MDDRDERLERLIREQRTDMANGSLQYPEPGVESYDRFESGSDPEFAMQIGRDRLTREWPECAYHGRSALRQQPGTYFGWACRECEAERSREYRSDPNVREKLAERTKQWRKDNPERHRDYAREYKRRRYHNDPEFRAREQARARERKARLKQAAEKTNEPD